METVPSIFVSFPPPELRTRGHVARHFRETAGVIVQAVDKVMKKSRVWALKVTFGSTEEALTALHNGSQIGKKKLKMRLVEKPKRRKEPKSEMNDSSETSCVRGKISKDIGVNEHGSIVRSKVIESCILKYMSKYGNVNAQNDGVGEKGGESSIPGTESSWDVASPRPIKRDGVVQLSGEAQVTEMIKSNPGMQYECHQVFSSAEGRTENDAREARDSHRHNTPIDELDIRFGIHIPKAISVWPIFRIITISHNLMSLIMMAARTASCTYSPLSTTNGIPIEWGALTTLIIPKMILNVSSAGNNDVTDMECCKNISPADAIKGDSDSEPKLQSIPEMVESKTMASRTSDQYYSPSKILSTSEHFKCLKSSRVGRTATHDMHRVVRVQYPPHDLRTKSKISRHFRQTAGVEVESTKIQKYKTFVQGVLVTFATNTDALIAIEKGSMFGKKSLKMRLDKVEQVEQGQDLKENSNLLIMNDNDSVSAKKRNENDGRVGNDENKSDLRPILGIARKPDNSNRKVLGEKNVASLNERSEIEIHDSSKQSASTANVFGARTYISYEKPREIREDSPAPNRNYDKTGMEMNSMSVDQNQLYEAFVSTEPYIPERSWSDVGILALAATLCIGNTLLSAARTIDGK